MAWLLWREREREREREIASTTTKAHHTSPRYYLVARFMRLAYVIFATSSRSLSPPSSVRSETCYRRRWRSLNGKRSDYRPLRNAEEEEEVHHGGRRGDTHLRFRREFWMRRDTFPSGFSWGDLFEEGEAELEYSMKCTERPAYGGNNTLKMWRRGFYFEWRLGDWKISTWNTNIRIIVFIPDEISSLHDGGKFESKF